MANKVYDGWRDPGEPDFKKRDCTEFEQTRSYMPHECVLSGKTIYPCEMAWCKTFYHYYNGKVAFTQWICKEEMLFAMIKGKKL